MSFRHSKAGTQRHHNDWRDWIDLRRIELIAIGLPPETYLDKSHWSDFLQNGHMHCHESSCFEFTDLSPGQLAALRRFLEREYGSAEQGPPILDWLRVRNYEGYRQ